MEGFKKVEITFLPTSIFNSSSFSVYGGQGQVLQRTGFVSICSLILCPMSMSLNEILISSVFFLFLVCIAISYLVFFFYYQFVFCFFSSAKVCIVLLVEASEVWTESNAWCLLLVYHSICLLSICLSIIWLKGWFDMSHFRGTSSIFWKNILNLI